MNFESIHNYYEPLVIDYLLNQVAPTMEEHDDDFFEDVACLALNRLPPRYVRHDVDTAFFLTSSDREEISQKVMQAVADAIEIISKD